MGEYAFPSYMGKDVENGMTLRDYFAAKVMQALLQGPDTCLVMGPEKDAVKAAYKIADAMLKEREK